jgi:hypothetical protein
MEVPAPKSLQVALNVPEKTLMGPGEMLVVNEKRGNCFESSARAFVLRIGLEHLKAFVLWRFLQIPQISRIFSLKPLVHFSVPYYSILIFPHASSNLQKHRQNLL